MGRTNLTLGLSQNLANEFRQKIESGQWASGERLPTTRELAARYQVSVNTIQGAFRVLEAHDLVERRPRRGGFVKIPTPISDRRNATTVGFIGVFAHDGDRADASEWTNRIVRGAEQELSQVGYHPSLLSYSPQADDEVRRLLGRIEQVADTLAGLVLFLSPAIYGLTDELDKRQIPWVTINRPHERAAQNFITHDASAGARIIGRCLARMNVDRVAVLSDPMRPGKSSADKFFGLLQGYVDRGGLSRNVDYVAVDGYLEQDGYARMEQYVTEFGVPKVVFASGDLLAFGAIRFLRDRGLSVPGDVGVIGATGLQAGDYTHPTLTVLDTPMERMGHEAARMLLQMARKDTRRVLGRFVPAPIIVRESFPIDEELLTKEGADLIKL